MPRAGHYRLKRETSESQWRSVIDELLPQFRRQYRLLFVAHDRQEAEFQKELAQSDEEVFVSPDYRDYIALYGRVKGVVANRVHGAVCAAGFGKPAVIVGNDARIGIARYIGIPAKDSSETAAEWIIDALAEQFSCAGELARQRIAMREHSAMHYTRSIAGLLQRYEYQLARAA